MATDCSVIVAVDERGGIGLNGTIPWNLPKDMARFKRLTTGSTVIMGRKTFESLPGRQPLPERDNIVISRNMGSEPGVEVVKSMYDALYYTKGSAFIIGGSGIYREGLSYSVLMYRTLVHHNFKCDVSFPEVDWRRWRLLESELHYPDHKHAYSFTFETWMRLY